jgi:DNA-binding GntR family transcriptional regulator
MHDDPSDRGRVSAPSGPDSGFASIYAEVRDRVCLLVYPPGTMLSENRLAREFGVSRTPIRRALQMLEFDGLVVSTHGVGTIVTTLDMRYLKQVYALRLKLLDLVAELPSGTVTDSDLTLLEGLLDRTVALRDAPPDPVALARAYQSFNEEVNRVIGNRPLREIADRHYYQTARVWLQLLPEMDWRQEVDAITDEITNTVAALRDADLRRLSEVRRHHFQWCLRRMNAVLVGQNLVEAVLPPEGGEHRLGRS